MPAGAPQGDATGFVVLTQGSVTRHIPYWLRVAAPALGQEEHSILPRPRFYRGDTSRGGGGTGLGLAIAQWVVELHGGSIAVVDAPAPGCRIRVSLPVSG